jgi:hypothetical protein
LSPPGDKVPVPNGEYRENPRPKGDRHPNPDRNPRGVGQLAKDREQPEADREVRRENRRGKDEPRREHLTSRPADERQERYQKDYGGEGTGVDAICETGDYHRQQRECRHTSAITVFRGNRTILCGRDPRAKRPRFGEVLELLSQTTVYRRRTLVRVVSDKQHREDAKRTVQRRETIAAPGVIVSGEDVPGLNGEGDAVLRLHSRHRLLDEGVAVAAPDLPEVIDLHEQGIIDRSNWFEQDVQTRKTGQTKKQRPSRISRSRGILSRCTPGGSLRSPQS